MSAVSLKGSIRLAGDKSISHRAVMFAAMASGKSLLRNLSRGADVETTISLFRELGIEIIREKGELIIDSGGFHHLSTDKKELHCGNSGTTLRLTLGILAGSKVDCELAGDASLNRRPVKRVIDPLNLMGGNLQTVNSADTPPVRVQGRPLHGITYHSPVSSAQVKSAVLLAALHADGGTAFHEPARSRDHTERFLLDQGIALEQNGVSCKLSPGSKIMPFDCEVPGDISTACFLIVAALLTGGSNIMIKDVLLNETRTGAVEILRAMGADIQIENLHLRNGEPTGDLIVSESRLKGIDAGRFDTARFIDEVPALAVAAMFAEGTTTFSNLGELRVKESDRLAGIRQTVSAYSCEASVSDNDLIILGGVGDKIRTPDHHHDHRLAMAQEIIRLIRGEGISGSHQEIISISAPEFYETIKVLSL